MNLRAFSLILFIPWVCYSQPIQITHDDSLYHRYQNAILSHDGQILVPLYTFGMFSGAERKGSIIAFDTASLSYTETDITIIPNSTYHYYPEWIFPSDSGYHVFGQALDTISWDIQIMMLELDQSLNIVRDSLFGQDTLIEGISNILALDSTYIIPYYSTNAAFPQNYGLISI